MNMPIFYVGGSKGGVGKSKLTFALVDYLLDEGKQVLLLESDTSNPDVYKAHHQHENDMLQCREVDLDTSDGWMDMVNAADEFSNHCLVINSAARSSMGIARYGATLRETLPELHRNLVTFWVINRQRDSIELLRGFLNVFPDALIHVCRNLYFGAPEKFELYNRSKSREIIERKGRTLDFPELADRVADKLYSGRMPLKTALDDRYFLPTGRRDNAVQVGGVNVYPARIAAKIQSLPGITACAVRPMRLEEGTRLKAFIVPLREEDTQELKRSLRRRLKRMLSAEECPVSFSFGPSLPRNSMGKLADW